MFWRYFSHPYSDRESLLISLKALNTLISNAVKQCETPEGPRRIKWRSDLVTLWIRYDPDGPAEQFLTLVRLDFSFPPNLTFSQAGFGYLKHEHAEYYHVSKWAQPEKRGIVRVHRLIAPVWPPLTQTRAETTWSGARSP